MKRIIAALLMLLSLSFHADAAKHSNMYETVWESTARFMFDPYHWCNSFSVNINPPTFLTATHCLSDDLGTINGQSVAVKGVSGEIAILVVDKALPMLPIGNRPSIGDEIVSFGFAGPAIPFFSRGQVITQDSDPTGTPDKHLMMFTNNTMHGMSGGPIVNLKGQVVSMIMCGGYFNQGDAHFGCGATYDDLIGAMNIAR